MQARSPPLVKIFLLRTAGPYIGSFTSLPVRAKIDVCPLLSKSGQIGGLRRRKSFISARVPRLSLGCAHFDASAISCCQRLTTPAIAAPRMGASQNNQSCAIYAPPAKSAGPVLRAGLTEALVTGIRKR